MPIYRHNIRLNSVLQSIVAILILAPLVQSPGAASPSSGKAFPPALKRASSAIAITDDGSTLVVVNPDSNSATLVDIASHSVTAELGVGVDPRSATVSPDGARAFIANQGYDSVSVIDLAAHAVITTVSVGDRPVGVAVSPDGRFVVVAELGDDRVRLLDASTLSTLSVLAVADRPHGLAFTPDGRRLLVTHLLSGDVTILNVQPFTVYLPLLIQSRDTSDASRLTLHTLRLTSHASLIATWPHVAPAPAAAVNAAGTRALSPHIPVADG